MNFYKTLAKQARQEIMQNIPHDFLRVTKLYNTLILYRNRKIGFIIKKENQPQIDVSQERDILAKMKEYSLNEVNNFNFQENKFLINILEEEQLRISNLPSKEYDYREDFIMKEINKFVKKTIAQKLPKNNLEK